MPLLRYFLFVGGALLAFFFVADAYAPKAAIATDTAIDLTTVRINSDRKWPDAVVFDTHVPLIAPRPAATTEAEVAAPAAVADISPGARLRDSLAQIDPADPKKLPAKLPPKRKLAKSHTGSQPVLIAQQPRSDFNRLGFFE